VVSYQFLKTFLHCSCPSNIVCYVCTFAQVIKVKVSIRY